MKRYLRNTAAALGIAASMAGNSYGQEPQQEQRKQDVLESYQLTGYASLPEARYMQARAVASTYLSLIQEN